MYFWLTYCDKSHVERIPIAVININHLFNLASEADNGGFIHSICFCFLTALKLMIMNT